MEDESARTGRHRGTIRRERATNESDARTAAVAPKAARRSRPRRTYGRRPEERNGTSVAHASPAPDLWAVFARSTVKVGNRSACACWSKRPGRGIGRDVLDAPPVLASRPAQHGTVVAAGERPGGESGAGTFACVSWYRMRAWGGAQFGSIGNGAPTWTLANRGPGSPTVFVG